MSVLQEWVSGLPFMQQTVLLAAIRGPDGVEKEHKAKALVRFLRRCILISAFDGCALLEPWSPHGGSFTGPSIRGVDENWELPMVAVRRDFIRSQDSLPLHYYLHALHAIEILAYKHQHHRIRLFWLDTYIQMAKDLHLHPESRDELDARLNDNEATWRADESRYKV